MGQRRDYRTPEELARAKGENYWPVIIGIVMSLALSGCVLWATFHGS